MKSAKKVDMIKDIIINLVMETMKMKKEDHPQKLLMAIFKVPNLSYLVLRIIILMAGVVSTLFFSLFLQSHYFYGSA